MTSALPPASAPTATDLDLDLALRVARDAVRHGLGMARTASSREVVVQKAVNDVATEVDRAVELAVRDLLVAGLPLPVQGEEHTPDETSPTRWVVDPIDGTSNYVVGLPLSAVNVALLVDGVPALGVTAALAPAADGSPGEDEVAAARGRGVWRGEERLGVRGGLEGAAVTVGDVGWVPRGPWTPPLRAAVIGAVGQVAGRIRVVGSSALELAWVAAGRTAGAVLFGNKAWDVAAGVAQVREAGGVVLDAHGAEWSLASDSLLAAADEDVAATLLDAVRSGRRAAGAPTS
ncbi:inositol monophosphatase family protein [Cellulomonas endophytica]|uniref:inositol monophosphatase family protein n=1 Tax=Cellulomonas endophytica TaxID=2494735 RepID=UPI0010104DB1|nr:inositol monophosphatase [Cellulomonas endophytica]